MSSKTGSNQHQVAGALACVLRCSGVTATVLAWLVGRLQKNNALSTKPEVRNVSQCRQRRTEPRPWVTYTENSVKFGRVVPEMFADRETDKHAYHSSPFPNPLGKFVRLRLVIRDTSEICAKCTRYIKVWVHWYIGGSKNRWYGGDPSYFPPPLLSFPCQEAAPLNPAWGAV